MQVLRRLGAKRQSPPPNTPQTPLYDVRSSRSENVADFRGHGVNRPGDLDLYPFTSEWERGSPVTWASVLSISILPRPSFLDIWLGTGQADRRQADADSGR